MRTTITIEDSLLERARNASAERKCSLGELIEEGLRVTLREARKPAKNRSRRPFKVFKGTGARTGVDLTSNRSILEAME
jgi:hypothetical protein